MRTMKPLSAFFCLILGLVVWLQMNQWLTLIQQQAIINNQNQLTHGVSKPQAPDDGKVNLVKATDFAYSEGWDASPIVIESHKLVFFTVPKAG